MKLSTLIPVIALKEVGTEEVDGTNCGPRVNEYKAATKLDPRESWPWCAAFVDWCVQQAMKSGTYTFERPTTAGAWDLPNWSLAQDDSTQTRKSPGNDIQAGDLVIYTFSHCGIALSGSDHAGDFSTVEGNTDPAGSREGGGVFKKVRNTRQVRARIRFTV
jgi:hypothetical protein